MENYINIKRFFNFLFKSYRVFILYPIYFLSHFFPRKKNIWVFGSHNDIFSENPKYMFLYVKKHVPSVRAIWITGSRKVAERLRKLGCESYYRYSIKGMIYSLVSKVYIFSGYSSDINFWLSGNTIKLNLWHGIPLKRIQYDVTIGFNGIKYNSKLSIFYKLLSPHDFEKASFILSPSKKICEIFSKAFKLDKSSCLNFGYPRCDPFFWNREDLRNHIHMYERELEKILSNIKKYRKAIIFMPTFRDRHMKRGIIDFEREFGIPLDDIDKKLHYKKVCLLVKLHPSIDWEVLNKLDYSNIIFLPSAIDIYPLLPYTDILITDYSSVMFDYLLLKKPIILFQPDRNLYTSSERGNFYFDPTSITPYATNDFTSLKKWIFSDELQLPTEDISRLVWGVNVEGTSSEKIVKFLVEFLSLDK